MPSFDRANAIKSRRYEIRQAIRTGKARVADLLRDPPEALYTMEIYDLLILQRSWGKRKVLHFLAIHEIKENVLIEELTIQQCRALATAMDKPLNPRGNMRDASSLHYRTAL